MFHAHGQRMIPMLRLLVLLLKAKLFISDLKAMSIGAMQVPILLQFFIMVVVVRKTPKPIHTNGII